MDKEVLKRQLTQQFQESLEQALQAVDAAPDGRWIAASEWEVREIFQRLTSDCYQRMIQQRIGQLPSESQAAFSPGGDGSVAGGVAAAEQRGSRGARADRRR